MAKIKVLLGTYPIIKLHKLFSSQAVFWFSPFQMQTPCFHSSDKLEFHDFLSFQKFQSHVIMMGAL